MSDLVLKCESIAKIYGSGQMRVEVLADVNLEVRRGEQIAIIGASGTGKSTLLHLLAGLDTPTRGMIVIDKNRISQMSEAERGKFRNQKLGFVYQFHHLLPEFTALENVMMPLLVRRTATRPARSEAAELLDRVGLSHRFEHKPGEMSGGERQRVAIARALVIRPVCLLADEPTGNIDRQNAEKIQQLMVELDRDLHTSLVVATHDAQLASSMDRTLKIEDGMLRSYDAQQM